MMQALLECDSLGRVHIRELLNLQAGNRLKPPDLRIGDNNILTAISAADSLKIYLQLKDRHSESRSESAKTIYISVPASLTGWQKIRIAIANILLIATGLCIAFGIFKLIKK
jgi:hypothetical protein